MLARLSDQEDLGLVADAVIECETAEELLRRVRETAEALAIDTGSAGPI
ncbi:MAG: hypothetical protein OXQ94_13015 [Gemmatimonadota bacterium]|nr:hypothetical protein [Gemmatimonadota bacterium]MDE2872593.1 hypothetical protein [Gemmatimonadota bacterium]